MSLSQRLHAITVNDALDKLNARNDIPKNALNIDNAKTWLMFCSKHLGCAYIARKSSTWIVSINGSQVIIHENRVLCKEYCSYMCYHYAGAFIVLLGLKHIESGLLIKSYNDLEAFFIVNNPFEYVPSTLPVGTSISYFVNWKIFSFRTYADRFWQAERRKFNQLFQSMTTLKTDNTTQMIGIPLSTNDCPICLSNNCSRQCKQCLNVFHENCLESERQFSAERESVFMCPVCRRKIKEE